MAERRTRSTRLPPATSPEERENQLITLAMEAAERQLLDGSASSQMITHFLKLGTTREQLEKAKIEREGQLLAARVEALEGQQRSEEMYAKALDAMRSDSGQVVHTDDEYYDD